MSKRNTSGAAGLIDNLLRRHVIQTAAIYVAVAWGAVEILITLTEKLSWPDWINAVALSFFVAGFPVVIILSWYRDLQSITARILLVASAIAVGASAFWLVNTSSGPLRSGQAARTGPYRTETIATVAILPFQNLTGDESQQYIASGFTDDLIDRLSKHPDLAVIQHESATSGVLDGLLPAGQAARLRAEYFVSGGLKKEGRYYEISAHLSDLDGNVIWSESFRDPLSAQNLLSTQKRISAAVSRNVGTRLSAPAYCGQTNNLTAMELYYEGRNRILMRRRENIEAGINLLKQALDEDPYYARAWNVLGEGYLTVPAWIVDSTESRRVQAMYHPMAMSAFERALQICPTLGFAYKIVVPANDDIANEWIDQEIQFLDSLAMDPNDVSLLRQYSMQLMNAGRISAALEIAERAYRIDPLAASILIEYARVLVAAGRCAEAIPVSIEGMDLGGSRMRFVEFNCARDADTLLEVLNHQQQLMNGNMMQMIGVEMSNEEIAELKFDKSHPRRSDVNAGIKAAWAANPGPRNFANNLIALLAVQLDDFDFAFEVLTSLVAGNRIAGFDMGHSGMWGPRPSSSKFRADARFKELMERIGLPEYWRRFGWPDHCRPQGDSFSCS